ncbi:IS3 family transposase [Bradyrhizobium quebecense]|uniref:IS3 family transposase n=1 Tax=Bradyrhizobium quebecense TaxID=2748629 RepID=UPI003B849895
MTAMLNAEGRRINRKRVQRLMRKMGIAALGPKPRTTKPAPGHKIFPYLLRHMVIDRPGLSISGGDHRLGEPCGTGMAPFEHDGHIVLRVCARRGLGAPRPA